MGNIPTSISTNPNNHNDINNKDINEDGVNEVDEKNIESSMLKNEVKNMNLKLLSSNDKIVKLESSLAYFQDILNTSAPKSVSKSAAFKPSASLKSGFAYVPVKHIWLLYTAVV